MEQLDMKIIIQKMLMLETRQLVNIMIITYFAQKIILQQNCKEGAKHDIMYRITWDRFVNIKVYKYNKKSNKWKKLMDKNIKGISILESLVA